MQNSHDCLVQRVLHPLVQPQFVHVVATKLQRAQDDQMGLGHPQTRVNPGIRHRRQRREVRGGVPRLAGVGGRLAARRGRRVQHGEGLHLDVQGRMIASCCAPDESSHAFRPRRGQVECRRGHLDGGGQLDPVVHCHHPVLRCTAGEGDGACLHTCSLSKRLVDDPIGLRLGHGISMEHLEHDLARHRWLSPPRPVRRATCAMVCRQSVRRRRPRMRTWSHLHWKHHPR
mmetsp:Transcript_142936/g.398274  ORF Transcript_142936/g.398274 Transcript_142936/m.398274 type:complete len:229 (-) Transcript_142936:684-1370(-)